MGKSAIKEKIIHRIEQIDNKTYLEALYNFLEASEPQEVYKLSKEQKEAIKEAKEQIKRGEFYTQEEVEKKMKKWARGK
jgi:predicted transcriptional regulator